MRPTLTALSSPPSPTLPPVQCIRLHEGEAAAGDHRQLNDPDELHQVVVTEVVPLHETDTDSAVFSTIVNAAASAVQPAT